MLLVSRFRIFRSTPTGFVRQTPFWIQLISAISVCDDTGVGYHGLKVVNLIDNATIEVK